LVVLLETLLQKDPAKRPQSPAELQALLHTLTTDLETERQGGKRSEIGRELNVAAILESSVERIDNRVRIITGLYDAATNKRLWGASYDREIKDIFAIQSDVAEQIAAALQAGLSADERANINQKPTENVAAYDFYLRGWGLYQLYQKDENEKAIDLFKQAIEADPKFALAYTGLADAYIERVQRFYGEDFWSDSAVDD
jgi:tetratricopeptide (TPR) repeat protein